MILFKAFCFHYERSNKEISIKNNYGYFHYDIARVYYNLHNNEETLNWCKKALDILSDNNEVSIKAINLSCRANYSSANYDNCIEIGILGLKRIRHLKYMAKTNKLWFLSNIKKYLANLDISEETIHFYMAESYLHKTELNFDIKTSEIITDFFKNALKHIEKAISMSDWEIYEKKYIYTICKYKITHDKTLIIPILEDFIEFSKNYKPNDNLFYIKYLYAHEEFYINKNKKKSLKIIDEVLNIDSQNIRCILLKKEITKSNIFSNLFK